MITSAKLFSLGFLAAGVFLLSQIILPVVSFKLFEISQKYSNILLISPQIPKNNQVLGVSIKNDQSFSYFVSDVKRNGKPGYDEFSISIPRLRIDHAKVLVDNNDPSTALAHLPGSALPGEKGNVFISGHSALSQLLSIENAIFARLPDVKIGDQIMIEAGGGKFNYKVVDIKIVDPKDVSVIAAPDVQGRYVSLMTCVPPGLNFKRLVVIGEII